MVQEQPPQPGAISSQPGGSHFTQTITGTYVAAAQEGGEATLNVTNNIYEHLPLHPLDPETLKAAKHQLDALPLEMIPDITPLPTGSRMRFSSNAQFVGRQVALRQLAAALKAGSVVALTGMGGIGKTQLASEFIHRYGQYFAGGVYWLSFADANAILAEVAECRAVVGLEALPTLANLPLEDQVRQVLAAWQSPLPHLLVFDNCEDEQLLRQWRPPTGGCRILVTSRRGDWDPDLGVQELPLAVLSRAESIELINKYRPNLPTTNLDAIAEELGDLPLALRLAAGFLDKYRKTHLGTPAAYLAHLRQITPIQHLSMQGKGVNSLPTDHDPNVERTFALSYEHLDRADSTDIQALALLARAAFFAPGEPVPSMLLLATVEQTEDDQDTVELLLVDALERLVSLGLLENLAEQELRLHRLLAAFVRLRIEKTETEAEARKAVEQTLLKTANELNKAGYPKPVLELQPHLRAITDIAQQYNDELAAYLCSALAYHLQMIGSYTEAYFYLDRDLAISEEALGPEHPDVATSLNNLAGLYKTQGKYEQAEPLYQRAQVIWEKALGPDHPQVAFSLNNLAGLYYAQGKYEQAESLWKRAQVIWEKALGPEHSEVARSLNNLAGLYYTQGKYEQAEPLLKRAQVIWEKALGPDHPDVALSLNNRAQLYYAQGKYEQAEPLYQRAQAIWEKALGPDHPQVATSLNNLALLYYAQGEYEQAEPLWKRALVIHEKAFGSDHPTTTIIRSNYSHLLQERKKTDKQQIT